MYLNLWLTKKTIIEFNHTTIDTEEEKENSSAKPFICYTVASRFVHIPRIISNHTNQNTDNILLWDNHTASSTARYLWQQHVGQSMSGKKHVWPAQSQNNSWKQQLDN